MKRKTLKKSLAILVALAMVLTTFGGFGTAAFAADNPVKFSVEISSKNADESIGKVKFEVYSDYSGKLVVEGDSVTANNATVTVTMTDVQSLGVTGTRTYTRLMEFAADANPSLSLVTDLFDKLIGTKVDFSFGGESVEYTVSGQDGTYLLTPYSSDDAAAVWHAMVNEDNFAYGTKDEEDSYIVIGNGSWLSVGNSILEFEEDYAEDLVLDNFGQLGALNDTIREAVVLNQKADTTPGVSFCLTPGTEIALGSSYARLIAPAAFEFELENYQALEDCLYTLQNDLNGNVKDMMFTLFGVLDTAFGAIGGTTVEGQGTIGETPNPDDVDVDKQDLANAVIEAIRTLGTGLYTSDSFQALVEKINAANAVLDNEDALDAEIGVAYVDLMAALRTLVPVDKEAEAMAAETANAIDALARELIGIYDTLVPRFDGYVASSVDAMNQAILVAEGVLANEDSSVAELRAAKSNLLKTWKSMVKKESLSKAVITGLKAVNYNGKAITQEPVVTLNDKVLTADVDYTVAYAKNKNAGKAVVTVTGIGNYKDSAKGTFVIKKIKQKMTAKAVTKTVKVKKVKKAKQVVSKVITVKKAQGKITYKKKSGSANLTIDKKGKVTVKKGTKKGTYKIKVQVKAAGNTNYKAAAKTVTVTIKVK